MAQQGGSNIVEALVVFIAGEFWPTQTGKDRWKLRANDGREFGVWDKTVYDGVMQHLNEPLSSTIGSKKSDTSDTWWNTLYGVPALGLEAARAPKDGAAAAGAAPDMSALVEPLNRIATAMENLLAWRMETTMRQMQPVHPAPEDGPQEPA